MTWDTFRGFRPIFRRLELDKRSPLEDIVYQLIVSLRERGAEFHIIDAATMRVRINAPTGLLTEIDKAALRAVKPQLVDRLRLEAHVVASWERQMRSRTEEL